MWNRSMLANIVEWVEQAYPSEGCGLVLELPDGGYRVQRCENLADKYHALDPESFPRTSREFYMINPMEFVRAEERGERVAVVFHSHPDVGDYFSPEDVAAAVMPRESADEPLQPSYPGTNYLVVSVRSGQADHATLFEFNEKEERFDGVKKFDKAALRVSDKLAAVGS
ncbi:MAG: Mov34/MPN/PAD-1 family protein [Bradymonadaceae bacterium]